jgi:hypothetical protein
MTAPLVTDAELAERFGITLDRLHELRRRHGWPVVRLGRFGFRFTEEQVAQILAMQTEVTSKPATQQVSIAGQTGRSASRRRAR